MVARLLTEKFGFTSGRVDRSGPRPVVRGVLLCGAVSANRRRYLKQAFAGGRVSKYSGRPVYIGHTTGRSERRYQDRLGFVRNPRLRADGLPIGDIEVNSGNVYAKQFLDDAENSPATIGMSHIASCETRTGSDGWDEVTEVHEVESVDVVLDPATTKGLFENINRRRKPMSTLKRLLSEIIRHPSASATTKRRAKRLREAAAMDDTIADAPADDMGEGDTSDDPNEAVTEAFKTAFDAIRDQVFSGEITKQEAKKKFDKLFDGHASVTAPPADDDSGNDDDDSDAVGAGTGAKESRMARIFGKPDPKGQKRFMESIFRYVR